MTPGKDIVVTACAGTGGVAAGGLAVLESFRSLLQARALPATVQVRAHQVGCRGFCAKDVLVDIAIDGRTSTYQLVTPDRVPRIIDEHLLGGNPVAEWLVGPEYHRFHGQQQKVVLANCGRIDPESIDDYLANGGYHAVQKALQTSPDAVIEVIRDSGLRGRGGAGFPTGAKWAACRAADGREKVLICNADEGDPGAFMDRSVLEGNPHAVIEGMLVGAWAIGASLGYVYVRAEYPLAVQRIGIALEQARARGYLGKGLFGRVFDFDIEVFLGAGAFVCGEETALITSIEDLPGEPKLKYVFPTTRGLWKRPTTINNVETWANVPVILQNGAAWFAGLGSERSKGTKIFSLVGKIRNTGLVEVPMGVPLRTIIEDIGGGVPGGKKLKAVQTGGPSGGCIPAELLDLPVDYENIARVGSIMGSGGMIVLDEDTCMVDMAKYFVSFCAEESCGQCTPCREGVEAMKRILTGITEGRGRREDLAVLEELSEVIIDSSLCGLGKTAPNPVRSTLRYFRREYLAHIEDQHCPAGVCKSLIPAPCQKACPAGIDVPSYVALIAAGRFEEAVRVIREDNPLPWVCGTVCPAPCESRCRRNEVDQGLSIRALKEFASRFSMDHGGEPLPPIQTRREERVAIVGSGPAGLSAAYYLAVDGYDVTVFEALPEPGGMLRVGIPPHRLPRGPLDREIDGIRRMGVKFQTGTTVGKDRTVDDLFAGGFRACYLAIGAHSPAPLGIPGESAAGVLQGVRYLKQLNLGEPVPDGRKVAVIGGGNVAIDVARSALRKGARAVRILYRRTRAEMPAYASEVDQALDEGIELSLLRAPLAILTEGERATGVQCIRMELGEPDASGRRRPVPVPGSEHRVEADLILPAIGQVPDLAALGFISGLRVNSRGTLEVNPATLQTGRPGLFCGGDAVTGPATVIEAIAEGKRAAIAVHAFLRGEAPRFPPIPRRRAKVPLAQIAPEAAATLARPPVALISLERRRASFDPVEIGLDRKAAQDEASRCLRCDLT